jgi:hypothetical protein
MTPTFEYESPVYAPHVVKSPPITRRIAFEKYSTGDIRENIYRMCVPIMLDRGSGLVPIRIRRCRRKAMVKVRVLGKSETVPTRTTEVPKNLLRF